MKKITTGVLVATVTTLVSSGCATQQVAKRIAPDERPMAPPAGQELSFKRLSNKKLRAAVRQAEQEAHLAIQDREQAVAAAHREAQAEAKTLIEKVYHQRGPIRKTVGWACDTYYRVTGLPADCSIAYNLRYIEQAPTVAKSLVAANIRQVDTGARIITNGVACYLGYLTGGPAPGAAVGGVFNLGANLFDRAKDSQPYTFTEGFWDFVTGAGSGALCGFSAQSEDIAFRHKMNDADRYVTGLNERNIANEAIEYQQGIDIAKLEEFLRPTPVPPPTPTPTHTLTPTPTPTIPTP
jgi:hypothetical protein